MTMAMGAAQVENYTSTFQMQIVKSIIPFYTVYSLLYNTSRPTMNLKGSENVHSVVGFLLAL
jgi:ABC-type uncharacterized transport system fused permease/ATPase subunit